MPSSLLHLNRRRTAQSFIFTRYGLVTVFILVLVALFYCFARSSSGSSPTWPSPQQPSTTQQQAEGKIALEELLKGTEKEDLDFAQDADLSKEIIDDRITQQAKSFVNIDHSQMASKKDTEGKVRDSIDQSRLGGRGGTEEPNLVKAQGTSSGVELQELYDGTMGARYPNAKMVQEYEDMVFCTTISDFKQPIFMDLLRSFVGGVHQLRQGRHRIPRIELFSLTLLSDIPSEVLEEISWWNNVHLRNVHAVLGLPVSKSARLLGDEHQIRLALLATLVEEQGHALWIKFGYVVEPQRVAIYKAETKGSVPQLLEAYQNGREMMMKLIGAMNEEGHVVANQGNEIVASNNLPLPRRKKSADDDVVRPLYKAGELVIEGYNREKGLVKIREQLRCALRQGKCKKLGFENAMNSTQYGVFPVDWSSQAGCLVDIREEGMNNAILVEESASTDPTEAFNKLLAESQNGQRRIRKMALTLPTTSKGMKEGETPPFLKFLIPSFFKTVTEEEYNQTLFTIYIGYDHNDPIYDREDSIGKVIQQLSQMIGDKPVVAKLIQLPAIRRTALLWNFLSMHALREGAEYLYQVNDDLTMKTSGWVSYFTSTLDANKGFGVVGPADYHNGLNCSILTQAMVTPVHFDIFGMLYPLEIKDWKSDRWLTYLYQPDDMFCRQDMIADNGGAPTRYQLCEFLSYIIYLEAGKRRIAEWKAKNNKV